MEKSAAKEACLPSCKNKMWKSVANQEINWKLIIKPATSDKDVCLLFSKMKNIIPSKLVTIDECIACYKI